MGKISKLIFGLGLVLLFLLCGCCKEDNNFLPQKILPTLYITSTIDCGNGLGCLYSSHISMEHADRMKERNGCNCLDDKIALDSSEIIKIGINPQKPQITNKNKLNKLPSEPIS